MAHVGARGKQTSGDGATRRDGGHASRLRQRRRAGKGGVAAGGWGTPRVANPRAPFALGWNAPGAGAHGRAPLRRGGKVYGLGDVWEIPRSARNDRGRSDWQGDQASWTRVAWERGDGVRRGLRTLGLPCFWVAGEGRVASRTDEWRAGAAWHEVGAVGDAGECGLACSHWWRRLNSRRED